MRCISFNQKSLSSFFILCFTAIFLACTGEKPASENVQIPAQETPVYHIQDSLKTGVIYPEVPINDDKLNSFALYLPKSYQPNLVAPVVFFFDPSGRGAVPLYKYKQIADSLGLIFIGSNVSKNGQDEDDINVMWNTLKNVSYSNFSIDTKHIILAGFSGGARVACAIASKEPGTTAVIANSAGMPQPESVFAPNTLFIGVAGKGDMNRAEMNVIEQHLKGTSLSHYYLEFDGIHEWAPSSSMVKAIYLSYMHVFATHPANTDQMKIDAFTEQQKLTIAQLLEQNKWVDAYNEMMILHESTKFFNPAVDHDAIDSLKNSAVYLSQKSELLKINNNEIAIQQELYKMMAQQPDTLRWKVKLAEIRKKSTQKGEIGMMHQRLLGYASLLCYSLSNRLLMAKNYTDAALMVTCYQIADPQNAEVYFFKAIIQASNRDKSATVDMLKKALSMGLSDKNRINQQKEFDFLSNDAVLKELLK